MLCCTGCGLAPSAAGSGKVELVNPSTTKGWVPSVGGLSGTCQPLYNKRMGPKCGGFNIITLQLIADSTADLMFLLHSNIQDRLKE